MDQNSHINGTTDPLIYPIGACIRQKVFFYVTWGSKLYISVFMRNSCSLLLHLQLPWVTKNQCDYYNYTTIIIPPDTRLQLSLVIQILSNHNTNISWELKI